MIPNAFRSLFCLFCLMVIFSGECFAGVEPYENFIKGQIRKNDSLHVKDEKFKNPQFNWSDITNISVQNSISLRILDEQAVNRSFSCKLTLKIEYFSDPEQVKATLIDSINLNVNYNKKAGAVYQAKDVYKFTNGYYVKVTVLDINSPEFGSEMPPVLELSNQIVVDRKYVFRPFLPIGLNGELSQASTKSGSRRLTSGPPTGNHLSLTWEGAVGNEEFDVEWVTIDENSEWSGLADSLERNDYVLDTRIGQMFRNNATRVTTAESSYLISLVYNSKFIAVRMRQAHYDDGIRITGDWFYKTEEGNEYAIWELPWHEENLNWQYSASYAEEGKKKEVVSYFDGTLRGRQTVTLSNSGKDVVSNDETVAVVQENIYDQFGRAAASILPAPVKGTGTPSLQYFHDFNQNGRDSSYNFVDLNAANCEPHPGLLKDISGASKYYSGNNDFKTDRPYNMYIPDAQGYPLSVTQYTADNTGRIKIQGGVGPVFQPGTEGQSRTTKYFYGKPEQWELDRLFGNDVGSAEHYLKNMVVDPNGQISLSYLNSGGKTIATALTGSSPENVEGLNSIPGEKLRKSRILKPEQFRFDGSALKLSATTTYMTTVTGTDTLNYSVAKLISYYGKQGDFNPCSNCFYNLTIKVSDDCGDTVSIAKVMPIKIGADTVNCEDSGVFNDTVTVNFTSIGSYYITFEFALDKDVIENFTDTYIKSADSAGVIKKKKEFILKHFKNASFIDCFSDCKTARTRLGTLSTFNAMFKDKLIELGEEDTTGYITYIAELHGSLSLKVDTLEMNCVSAPVSPCDKYRTAMLADVSPGGQYALMDSLGNFIEPEINVITNYFQNGVFNPGNSTDSLYIVTKDDGNTISAYDNAFTIEDLKKYWRSEWAVLFLPFHPEYCKLNFCNDNSVSMSWDEKLRNTDAHADIPKVTTGVTFDNLLSDWLLPADPFFIGNGIAFKPAMENDLNNYTSRVLKLSATMAPAKGLSEFVDYQLYCSDSTATTYQWVVDRWTTCNPVDSCRVKDREWQLYRDFYLDLKQVYLDSLRNSTTCEGACEIGTPVKLPPSGSSGNTCETVLNLGLTGIQLTRNKFVEEYNNIKYFYTFIKGTPGEIPINPDSCSSNSSPLFFSCISVLLPDGTYRKFNNVWSFNCEEVVGNPCVNSGYFYSDGEISAEKFYELDPYNPSLRNEYTFILGYDQNNPPVISSCGLDSELNFYDCFTVYDSVGTELMTYNNVWVSICFGRSICEYSDNIFVDEEIDYNKFNYYSDPYTRSELTVIENQESTSPPWYLPCNGTYSTWQFFDCLDIVISNGLVRSYSKVWVFICNGIDNWNPYYRQSIISVEPKIKKNAIPQVFQLNNFVDEDKKTNETIITDVVSRNVYSVIKPNSIKKNTILNNLKPEPKTNFKAYEFTALFTAKIGSKSYRKMRNVWVAKYDPQDQATKLQSRMVGRLVNCSALLLKKVPHFTSVNRGDVVSNVDSLEAYNNAESELHDSIASFSKNNANMWMKRLDSGFVNLNVNVADTILLRAKLIELSIMGGDTSHPFGASSLKSGGILVNGIPCSSFGDIIKAVFGITKFTEHLNPWLIESPYPYSPVQHAAEKLISNTSAELCEALDQLKPSAGATPQQFYDHLKTEYGSAMNLDFSDFNVLLKGCGNCRFLLEKDIILPLVLIPGGKGCITKTEYTNAMDSLRLNFSIEPDTTWSNYKAIVTNYLNFKWGFSFSYDQYQDFANDTTKLKLCNEALYTSFDADPYACIKTAIEVAHGQASYEYQVYINEERDKFRNAYVSDCAEAKPSVDLSTKERIYHYTLYYYDLAGNLIRTVPPEGVNPLPDIDLPKVDKARMFDPAICNYNGPSVNSDKVTAFQTLSGTLANSGNSAVEMWLYQTGESGKQVIATTPDMKYMFQTCINNNLLSIDVYSLQQDDSASVSIIHSNHVTTNIPPLLYDVPWTHVVVQGTNLASGALEVWINGKLYPAVEGSGTAGCDWTISSLPVLQPMPENIASLKHLRLYGGRLMTAGEISANAESGCFYISDTNNSDNFRFNVPDPGGVTLAEGSSVETQFKTVYPLHSLTTTYAYNSTNQVIRQASPDGGTSRFWYDNLSRLIISQNARQAPDGKYSYTDYDPLGRITEVGEKTVSDTTLTRQSNPEYLSNSFYRDFLSRGSDAQLTQTTYDMPATGPGIDGTVVQNNLRKRVAASVYRPTRTSADINASYYDYDLSGNVKTLYQQLAGLDSTRRLSYEYDLVSGKVNLLAYQHGKRDRFYYKYNYDAENRLTEAYSSDSANVDPHSFRSTLFNGHERLDAKYQYYLHGPLARMELGRDEQKVQGLDYVYTLQGWLKGVNGNKLSGSGGDVGDDKATVAKDALAYSLGYYSGDYTPIGGSGYSAFGMNYQPDSTDVSGLNLYNGNISNSTYAIANIQNGNTVGYTYKYDQLNRLKKLRQHNLSSVTGTWNTGNMNNGHYSEDFDYDGNGNILALKRNAAGTTMDQLSYAYNRDGNSKLLNNQLSSLADGSISDTSGELKGTTSYGYDAIGNLISDSKEGITGIDWTVYGKIGQINKTDSAEKIVYSYDPTGNRVSKTSNEVTTWYVRDAQGNSLAVYDNKSGGVNWREQQLYGSSRLGMWRPNFNLATDSIRFKWNSTGLKFFELNNHLGNVMSVISDNRTGSAGDYTPVVINAQDYYAFGSVMPGREYALDTTSAYRYGFNGQEKSDEISGEGNHTTAEFWEYDTRLGRRWNLDPKPVAWESGYAANRNNPIANSDPKGDDPITAILEGVTAFGIEAGLDFMTSMVVKGEDASTAFNNINWKGAAWEGAKATAISAFMPTGTQTAARIAKISQSKIGKLTASFVANLSSEVMKNFVSGNYSNAAGNFDYSLLEGDFENLVYTAGISTLLEAGMGGKAEELYKNFSKSNSKLAKQYEKLFKNLDSKGSTVKTIENRTKKVNEAAKTLGKDALKATGAKVGEETVKKIGDETQKKVRGVE
jgi:hypothetical protein